MKVFIDANVLVSAFATTSVCTELLILIRQRHQLVFSVQVLDELERALLKKFKVPAASVALYRTRLEARALIQADPKASPKRCRDLKDDAILQAALDADADWLVTGDADLLVLKRVDGMPISSPRDFMEAMGVEDLWD